MYKPHWGPGSLATKESLVRCGGRGWLIDWSQPPPLRFHIRIPWTPSIATTVREMPRYLNPQPSLIDIFGWFCAKIRPSHITAEETERLPLKFHAGHQEGDDWYQSHSKRSWLVMVLNNTKHNLDADSLRTHDRHADICGHSLQLWVYDWWTASQHSVLDVFCTGEASCFLWTRPWETAYPPEVTPEKRNCLVATPRPWP